MTQSVATADTDKEQMHRSAERDIGKFSYRNDDGAAMDFAGGLKKIMLLGKTPRTRLAVQVVKEGGENNLHYHTGTDIVYMVLQGRVKFHGPEGAVYGEFDQHEGLVIPAGARYWFETTGEVPLELFQVFFYSEDPATAKRINLERAKDWMAGNAVLQVYEDAPGKPSA